MGGMGGGGIQGWLANRRLQQMQGDRMLNEQLMQGGQMAQQRNLASQREEFERQQQQQREQFEKEQQERQNTLMEQRQWQSPEATLGFQKERDAQQQRQNLANF